MARAEAKRWLRSGCIARSTTAISPRSTPGATSTSAASSPMSRRRMVSLGFGDQKGWTPESAPYITTPSA
jgi:hypothetical protein